MPPPRSHSSRHSRRRHRDEESGNKNAKPATPPSFFARLFRFVGTLAGVLVVLAAIFAGLAWLLFQYDSTLFYDWTAAVVDPNIPRPGEPFNWSWLSNSKAEEIEYSDLLHPLIMKAMLEGSVRIKPKSNIDAFVDEDDPQTIAYYAALNGLLEPFQFYFKRGMNRSFTYAGRPMLHAAIESRNLELVTWMLKQGGVFDLEGTDEKGQTALIHLILMMPDDDEAVERRDEWLEIRERIRSEGEGPSDAERDYYLHSQPPIVFKSDELIHYKLQILKLLKLHNANFNHLVPFDGAGSYKDSRYSALTWALENNDPLAAGYLLELGADPLSQHPAQSSLTAFDYAMELNNANLVKVFLDYGSDPWLYSQGSEKYRGNSRKKEAAKLREHRFVVAVKSQWVETVRAFLEFNDSTERRYLTGKVVKSAIEALQSLPSDAQFQPQLKALFIKHNHMEE